MTRIRKKQFSSGVLLPPFFIPIAAFILWALALAPYFSILKLDLYLSGQLIAAHYFISYLILIFAWALSGPMTAGVLSFFFAGITLYLFLVAREPAYLLQVVFYVVFYTGVLYYLLNIQKKNNAKQIGQEKLIEEYGFVEGEILKKGLLIKALENKVDRFLGLSLFSEELKEVIDVEAAAKKITKKVYEALSKTEECALYLVNENRQRLSLIASESPNGAVIKEKEGSIFDLWAMKNSQGLMIEDTQNDFRFPMGAKLETRHLRSVCVSPLMTGNKVLGVIRASASLPDAFNADDLRLLDIFASLGSVTLKNLLLYERMKEMAIHDGLTGLYLKRYFQERLLEEKKRADYNRASFGLILIDIDYFKRYNDEFGHAAGDIVLKSMAAVITECLEPSDLAARYGGEEFIVLLPNKKRAESHAIAENLRAAVEAYPFVFRRVEARVTASLGVVTYPDDGHSDEELIRKADQYLYRAKSLGRNRVCGNC